MKKNTQPKVHVMDTIFRNKRILSFLVAAFVLLSTFPLGVIISNAAPVDDFTVTVTDDSVPAVPIGGAKATFKNTAIVDDSGTSFTDDNNDGIITIVGLDDANTYKMEVSARGYVTYELPTFDWATVDVALTKDTNSYDITATVTGGNGSIEATPTSVPAWSSTTITVTADEGYKIKSLKDNGTDVTGAAGATDLNYDLQVFEDHELVVEFEKLSFEISAVVTGVDGGTITASPTTVPYDTSTTITVNPKEGYQIKSLKDGDTDVTMSVVNNQYELNNVRAEHNFSVEFERIFEIDITYLNNDHETRGIVTYQKTVVKDSPTEIVVTAKEGFQIKVLKDGSDSIDLAIGQSSYTYRIDSVVADHTITIKFVACALSVFVRNENDISVENGGWTNGNLAFNGTVNVGETTLSGEDIINCVVTGTVSPTPAAVASGTIDTSGNYLFSINDLINGEYLATITAPTNIIASPNNKKTILFNVDNDLPVVGAASKLPAETETNQDVTISGTASDIGGSLISKIRYSNFSSDFAADTYNSKASAATIDAFWDAVTNSYSFTIDYACNTTFYIWTYDNAGNKSELSQSIYVHIDRVAPTIDSITKDPASTSTNQNVTISGKASDIPDDNTSGVAEVRYSTFEKDFADDSLSTSPSTTFKATWDASSGTYEFTVTEDCDSTYYVWAYDEAGNKSADKKDIAVLIDTIIPTVDTINTTSVDVTKTDVTISGNASDNSSGIKEVRYSNVPAAFKSDTSTKKALNTEVATWDSATNTYKFTVVNECNTIYYVWAYDDAGNKSGASIENPNEPIQSIPVLIDKTLPVITSITKSPSTDWSAGAVTLTANCSDGTSTSASGIVKMYYGTTKAYEDAKLIKDVVTAGSKYKYTTPNSEFNAPYYFWAVDAAGNVSNITNPKEILVNIDKTKPFIKSLTFSVDGVVQDPSLIQISDYGYYFPKDTTVTITAQDDALSSGIKSITYYTVSEGIQSAQVTQNVVDNKITFDVKANFKGWIFAKATDMVGNVTDAFIKPTAGVIVEDAAKHLETSSISLVTPATTNKDNTGLDLYSGNVNVDVTVSDLYSGIDKIEWSIESAYDAKQSGTTNLYPQGAESADTTGWTVTKTDNILITELTKTLTVSNNSNAIKVYVKLTDRAGNTSEKYITFSIDKTAPTINLTYDNNSFDASFPGEYQLYKADRTATIVVTERNFSASDVISAITNTDGVIPSVSGWTESKNTLEPDKTTYTARISYIADGDYTFDMQFKDLADLQAAAFATDKFTVDKTIPVIQVSYDNNDAKNTNYFAKERTALITIKEHNFETGRIVITGTAADGTTTITFPAASSWTTSGDTHTASIRYAADALYTFDISYADKAGNATQDFLVQSFYIDKTAPAIAITGIKDKSANKGDVIPVISLTDTNYDKDTVTLTLKGANQGNTICNGSFASITGGEEYTFENFEKTKAVDDIYTLTAKTTDQAGNETTSSITFSVNRFGSVYVFGETLKSITGRYVQRAADVTITESNVDELEADKTKVKLTKNGEQIDLKEGTDYTVKHTGGEGGWSQYSYVLPAALFTDDAKYVITLYSEDAAGNINENIAESKKSEIWFGVDKTLPVIIATDLASGKTYALESKIVTADISDNLVLGSVKIFINDVEIAVTEENGSYTFAIPGSNAAQQIKITAVDSAGNELVKEFKNVYVTTNLAVRWYTNTPLFIGSIVLIVLLVIALAYFLVFPKRRRAARH